VSCKIVTNYPVSKHEGKKSVFFFSNNYVNVHHAFLMTSPVSFSRNPCQSMLVNQNLQLRQVVYAKFPLRIHALHS